MSDTLFKPPLADVIRRLRLAVITTSNDDESSPRTTDRDRHLERLLAMEDAAEALEDIVAGRAWA